MDKDFDLRKINRPALPENSFNDEFTALPKETSSFDAAAADADVSTEVMDYGDLSLEDAMDSGYTDPEGRAVEMALPEIKGSPTGAYTDVGAGRSSAVTKSRSGD